MGYRVAVVGATGNVGREMLNILAERQFPLDEVAAVASSRSTGVRVEFGDTDEMLTIRNLEHFDFAWPRDGGLLCGTGIPGRLQPSFARRRRFQ